MSEEIFKEKVFTQHDVQNEKFRKEEREKLRKEENEKLRNKNENTNENEQLRKNNVVEGFKIKKSIEKTEEIKSPNWFDKNKFKNTLAIIDWDKFNYKNKIGEFKYIHIKNFVNNIRNNTITEISAKNDLNMLNKIKNAEIIKYKKHNSKQKEL